jgi:hypothetical protein
MKDYTADEFMEAIKSGMMLQGTDKDYKAYLGSKQEGKFYYEKLSMAQREEFVKLYNDKKINIEPEFGLYVTPFFMKIGA